MRVLVFGDSIAYGKWDKKGGWVDQLKSYYDNSAIDYKDREFPSIYNLSISGDETRGVLDRFTDEVYARWHNWKGEGFAFIFAIGTNDSAEEGSLREKRSSSEIYTHQLEELIKQANKFSNKILFVGLLPVDETRTKPVYWKDVYWSNNRIRAFDKAMEDVALKNNCVYIPFYDQFENKKLLSDGLHPTSEGHDIIFEKVRPALDELLK